MAETPEVPTPDTNAEEPGVPPSPALPKIPSTETLQSWLPLYLQKTDRAIDKLSRILATSAGTDKVLLTICYTSLLSSSVLKSLSVRQVHRAVRQLIEKAISLPPNTTVLIDTASIPPSRLYIASERLKALSGVISDFRIFVRLWGLIGVWKWGKSVWNDPPKDRLVRVIAFSQVLSILIYQYLENGAYLATKRVLKWSKQKETKAWLWSCRFWMAYVGLDFIRLFREYALKKRRESGTEKNEAVAEQDAEWAATWRRELVVNMAWAPLTLHWSLETGLVNDFWVGFFGSVAGVVGITRLWKTTSDAS
ncbi:hypothetical protein F5884DRAFT_524901 [Xylogone sp. PMI_703]|nr:hypothetical protein F5884DRAFT_524901 [Xylogone sp. PMI_703]